MKKVFYLTFALMVVLAGCSSSEPVNYSGEYSSVDEDGIETITTIEYTKDGDDITDVTFNSTKDGVDKRDEEAYPLNADGGGAGTWSEQADAVADYIVENDEFPTLDDEGLDADGSTSATIHLSDFESAFNAAEEE